MAQRHVTIIIADPNQRGSGVSNLHHHRTETTWQMGKFPTSLQIRTHMTQRLTTRIITQPRQPKNQNQVPKHFCIYSLPKYPAYH